MRLVSRCCKDNVVNSKGEEYYFDCAKCGRPTPVIKMSSKELEEHEKQKAADKK